jgi:hypothetical protein
MSCPLCKKNHNVDSAIDCYDNIKSKISKDVMKEMDKYIIKLTKKREKQRQRTG